MDWVTEVIGKVKNSAGQLSDPDDYLSGISGALMRYSNDRARVLVADIAGAGVHDYPLPEGWSEGASIIQSVEYPAGKVPETMLDRKDFKLYQAPDGVKLRIIPEAPDASSTMRVAFTALHTTDTVPEIDQDAVQNLAASFCLRRLASLYLQTSDPVIAADVVNYRSKGDEANRRANDLEKQYKGHLGLKDGDDTPPSMASAVAPDSSRIRLTHPVRRLP